MISLTHVLCVQDLNNTNLNKSPVGNSGGGYRAPGGPMSSPPAYRLHGGDLSPRPSTPTSPSTQRAQSSASVTVSPSSSFSPSYSAGGTVSPSGGGSGMYLDPKLLINKSPSELPQGVDPGQREVGAEFWIRFRWHKNMEIIMC